MEPGNAKPSDSSQDRTGVWVIAATAAVSALVIGSGVVHGELRGAAVTEVQILAVGLAAYFGLR